MGSVEAFVLFILPFTVNDHQLLKYLPQACSVSPKILRWQAIVGEFDFEVKCIQGGENVVADSLYRTFSIAEVEAHYEILINQENSLDFQKRNSERRADFKVVTYKYTSRSCDLSHVLWSLKKGSFHKTITCACKK